jgi:hypothetical protein
LPVATAAAEDIRWSEIIVCWHADVPRSSDFEQRLGVLNVFIGKKPLDE